MVTFTKKELFRLAELSSLKLSDQELDWLQQQLTKTLGYIQQIEAFQLSSEHEPIKNINVFREDIAVEKDSAPLLAQAPELRDTYFVVPKILDQQ